MDLSQAVISALAEAKIIEDGQPAECRALPNAEGRADRSNHHLLRCSRDGRQDVIVHIGPDLETLRRRHMGFANACPDIAIPLLGHGRLSNGLEWQASPYFAGKDLESLVLNEVLAPDEGVQLARSLMASLRETERVSTREKAHAELDGIIGEMLSFPGYQDSDRNFLNEAIFPQFREAVEATQPVRRWTNGDFIIRNVLVDASLDMKLIDYEFASDTHFFFEDEIRWGAFSRLHRLHLVRDCFLTPERAEPWQLAFFALRQAAMSWRSHGLDAAKEALSYEAPRVRKTAELWDAKWSGSAFFGS